MKVVPTVRKLNIACIVFYIFTRCVSVEVAVTAPLNAVRDVYVKTHILHGKLFNFSLEITPKFYLVLIHYVRNLHPKALTGRTEPDIVSSLV